MPPPTRRDFRKRRAARPLADLVGPLLDPALARRGFGQSDIIMFWDEIVGERLAAAAQPISLQWPARARGKTGDAPAAAALLVRVESAFALELQHLSGAVIERVNSHLGWRCVDRLVLKQGPVERRPVRAPRPAPDPAIVNASRAAVGDFDNSALRDALTRLGAHVLTRSLNGA